MLCRGSPSLMVKDKAGVESAAVSTLKGSAHSRRVQHMPRGSSPLSGFVLSTSPQRDQPVQSVSAPSRPAPVDSQIASGCIQDAS